MPRAVGAWLGIVILVAFSVGLSLFMRLERSKAPPRLEPALQRWRPAGAPAADGSFVEARVLRVEGGLFRKVRFVEQRRRRGADGEILEVLEERAFELGVG